MPTPALLLLIATLLPLGAFLTLLGLGRRMGEPLAGVVATVLAAGSFGCSIFAMMAWLAGGATGGTPWGAGQAPLIELVPWLPAPGAGWLDVGIYLDSLTIILFFMINAVSVVVHIFSIGYLRGDPRFARFFTLLGLFMFSMLALVLSATLLQIFIFWELVGLCSYLLIGFWFERKAASRAAVKAFVMNRVGDVGFLVGMGLLLAWLGNVTLPDLWYQLRTAGTGAGAALADGSVISNGWLTLAGVLLFVGAMGKSAQVPLHTWLVDAMEGPTPVSALIHAATMVAAGVYLVGRVFPVLTPDAKFVIAIVGCVTMLLGALVAVAQTDIKRVLAYSTVSQLGMMMLALGVGSWAGALFHLLTHGFFKALLFLSAGSVIDAAHHQQDMRRYGGLFMRIPVTAVTFGIGVLAISGTPFLSGYFSKDMILTHAGAYASLASARGLGAGYWVFFIVPVVVTYLTAFYMMRCWALTFLGKPRDAELSERATELPIMWLPMCGLAVFTIIAGYAWSPVRESVRSAPTEMSAAVLMREADAAGVALTVDLLDARRTDLGAGATWPVESPSLTLALPDGGDAALSDVAPLTLPQQAHVRGESLAHAWTGWAFAIGMGLAVVLYGTGLRVVNALLRRSAVRTIHDVLLNGFYIDNLYRTLVLNVMLFISRTCAMIDRVLVDGAVNGVAWGVRRVALVTGWQDLNVVDRAVTGVTTVVWNIGNTLRSPQTGQLRLYVTVLMLCVGAGLAAVVVLMLLR